MADRHDARRAYAIVEGYFMGLVYLIVKCRFHYLLRYLSLPAIQRLSRALARLLRGCAPAVGRETRRALSTCFPDLTPAQLDGAVRDHLTYVVLNMVLFPALTAMPDGRIERLLDSSELERALADHRDRFTIFVGAHFYSHVTVGLVSRVLFQQGEKLCISFQLKEDEHVRDFLARAKAKAHWDRHCLVNVATRDANSHRRLAAFLQQAEGSLFIMGDFRLRPARTDVPFRVGHGVFHSNAGFRFAVEHAPESAVVVPCHLLVEDGKIRVKCGRPLEKRSAVKAYYEEVLPHQIARSPAQWQLWYLSGALLTNTA